MSIYSIANRTTSGTTAAAAQEIISGANNGYRILELGISLAAATASVFGFGRPSTASVTPTSPVTVLAEDAGNTSAGVTTTALAWATPPGAPAGFNRRASFPATIGAGILFTFPRGFICLKGGSGVNGSTVIWNLATNPVIDSWVVVDE